MSPAQTTSATRQKAAAGKTAAAAQLPPEIFDAKVNVPLIHQVVVAQEAAARQGTHSTKTRGDVRGGGKKPYRQKGTGRARQGSIRAPAVRWRRCRAWPAPALATTSGRRRK